MNGRWTSQLPLITILVFVWLRSSGLTDFVHVTNSEAEDVEVYKRGGGDCASHRIIRFGRTKGNHDHDA